MGAGRVATTSVQRSQRGGSPPRRSRSSVFRDGLSTIGSIVVVAALLGFVLVVRTYPGSPRTTVPVSAVVGGAPTGTPDELKAAAATLLDGTTAKGGTGYRFEIVQRSTILAKPDGPKIEDPDPIDRTKTLGLADEYYLIGLTETGYVTPDGFTMEMRQGPTSAAAKVDLAAGQLLFRALSTKATTYRDDGDGWYETTSPPGIGLDPATAALLPDLLRHAAEAQDVDPATLKPELVPADPVGRALRATGSVKDIPGVVAVDGAPFTELTEPIDFTFDAAGRVTGLVVTARNTNLKDFDLVVVTEIAIRYDAVPVDLPAPTPAYSPDPSPSLEP